MLFSLACQPPPDAKVHNFHKLHFLWINLRKMRKNIFKLLQKRKADIILRNIANTKITAIKKNFVRKKGCSPHPFFYALRAKKHPSFKLVIPPKAPVFLNRHTTKSASLLVKVSSLLFTPHKWGAGGVNTANYNIEDA
jgi:hypothetical protein